VLVLFGDSQDRIRSMALIHEKLYQSGNLAGIDFTSYIDDLAAALLRSYGVNTERISLQIVGEKVWLDIDTAIPCGLILQELLSNCLKHAFPGDHAGEIHITLHAEAAGKYVLTVRDTGVGFPEALDFRHTESLGLQLVIMLTEQLGGTIMRQSGEGTTFTLFFNELGCHESH
jgi:two-component sensor histidine kinase